MTTQWTHILHFVVVAADNTAANRQAFAEFLANNGSGESVDDEKLMFNTVTRLSVSGNLPAQGYGLSVPVKPAIRQAFENFASTLTNYRYFAVRQSDGVLALTNSAYVSPPVADFGRADVLQAINAERVALGANPWQVIPNEEGL